jgi:hypothetical protein
VSQRVNLKSDFQRFLILIQFEEISNIELEVVRFRKRLKKVIGNLSDSDKSDLFRGVLQETRDAGNALDYAQIHLEEDIE